MTFAFLFPGQGSQAIGMGQALARRFAVAAATFDEAEGILELPIRQLCWEGPEASLRATENAQVALFVTSLAAYRSYREQGGAAAAVMAGHSLGEYSACCAAGALSFAEALKLVRRRGELMARAEVGTMAAILGLESAKLEAICAGTAGVVVVANYNAADQLVISGQPAAVAQASESALAAGAKRVIPLAVAGAFHSPLMEVAAADLSRALFAAAWHDAEVPVIANVDAGLTRRAPEFAPKLALQLSSSVRWTDTMRAMRERGVEGFVEMGTGKVLSGLVKKFERRSPTFLTEDPEALVETLAAMAAPSAV